jgi:hypothetical protein
MSTMTDGRVSTANDTLSVPEWLGQLTATERRVWQAFGSGELVDLRTGDAELDAAVATVLSVAGWALSIAIAAAATRTLTNN